MHALRGYREITFFHTANHFFLGVQINQAAESPPAWSSRPTSPCRAQQNQSKSLKEVEIAEEPERALAVETRMSLRFGNVVDRMALDLDAGGAAAPV
jgi:hypothetical protein